MLSNSDYEALEDLLCSEIKKVVKKGEIKDATEVKGVKDALEAIKIIHCLKDGEWEKEDTLGYYPMHHSNYGHVDFNGTYGRRNPHTRRYMSNGMPDTTYGHSIKDRMVAALEPLYDKAESNYEHGMIQKAINSVQSLN
jgi:hypothetical protein